MTRGEKCPDFFFFWCRATRCPPKNSYEGPVRINNREITSLKGHERFRADRPVRCSTKCSGRPLTPVVPIRRTAQHKRCFTGSYRRQSHLFESSSKQMTPRCIPPIKRRLKQKINRKSPTGYIHETGDVGIVCISDSSSRTSRLFFWLPLGHPLVHRHSSYITGRREKSAGLTSTSEAANRPKSWTKKKPENIPKRAVHVSGIKLWIRAKSHRQFQHLPSNANESVG